jgi:hypothetical protein
MPPHCDSLDGPVVRAARRALETTDVALVLPYVPKAGEREIIDAFEKVLATRKTGAVNREVADRYFFETVVRIHRAGEGAPFTGLKPAGLDVGPIIPIAERAIEGGNRQALEDALVQVVRSELAERFSDLEHLRGRAEGGVDEARAYVGAMLGLQVWAHGVYKATKARGHAAAHAHGATKAAATVR